MRPHAAHLARGAQSKPVSYLHVGMVQHDPAGRIAFLHRTAEGKFHPFVRDFRHVHVLTVPLSPVRAAATLGNRQRHMGFEKLQVGPKPPTLSPQAQAAMLGSRQRHWNLRSCRYAINSYVKSPHIRPSSAT